MSEAERDDRGTPAEENVAKLLARYRPEPPDARFTARVEARLLAAAAERRAARTPLLQRVGAWAAAAAVLAAALAIGGRGRGPTVQKDPRTDWIAALDRPAHGLVAAPLAPAVGIGRGWVGSEVRTGAGERRRLPLEDGSVLYVDQATDVRIASERRIDVRSGEVYLDVAPDEDHPFRVALPDRELTAVGTRFGVRVAPDASQVLVTHGAVQVGGGPLLRSGERLVTRGKSEPRVETAPRASHELSWMRDLVAAAQSPLVPSSEYAGGAILAIDPAGQEMRLSLRRFDVDVHIEDGFARTTIDQTYFNHATWRMEGTFHFPLPADASLSRLAMYVNGRLMEGGMAERNRARDVYEQIRYTRRDPALLEWIDGSTFKMRVFPLEPREEKRILLSYVQRLPSAYGKTTYRFPAGHTLGFTGSWSFTARVAGGADRPWSGEGPALRTEDAGDDLLLRASAEGALLDRDVVVHLAAPTVSAAPRFGTVEHEGARYLLVRWRPDLPSAPQHERRDWVVLFESSGDRDPVLARAQVEIVRGVLAQAEPGDTLAVLSASRRAEAFADERVPATRENVAAALRFLESSHLIGALDLGVALDATKPFIDGAEHPVIVHVGSGVAVMGERDPARLVDRVPAGATYVGIGVGNRWSRPFLRAAAARTGGLFAQVLPSEPLAWRAFEIASALATPRLLNVQVSDNSPRTDAVPAARFLSFTDAVAHGEEIAAVARLASGDARPETVLVSGTLNGQPFQRAFPVTGVTDGAGYLPREWARLEIERLCAEDGEKHREAVVALSKATYVMSPFTSLLVLEDDAMYEQFKVDRGRKDHWALYAAPERIEVVREPVGSGSAAAPATDRAALQKVLDTVLVRQRHPLLSIDGLWWGARARTLSEVRETVGVHGVALPWFASSRPSSGAFFNNGSSGDFRARTENVFDDWSFWWGAGGGGPGGGSGGVPGGSTGTFDFEVDGATNWRQWSPDARTSFAISGSRPAVISGLSFELDNRVTTASWNLRAAADGLRRDAGVDLSGLFAFGGPQTPGGGEAGGPSSTISVWTRGGYLGPMGEVPPDSREPSDPPPPSGDPGYMVEATLSRLGQGWTAGLLRSNPGGWNNTQWFTDLLGFAPAMDTWSEDVAAVLEDEAGQAPVAGDVDAAARALLDRARSAGWTHVRLAPAPLAPGFDAVVHSDGRFRLTRTLATGFREDVWCDGERLVHAYPDLGVGATRRFTRHYAHLVRDLLPWFVPSADDLARGGADVRLVGERVVAVLPRGNTAWRIDLEFGADGLLAERRVVRTKDGKVLRRTRIERPSAGTAHVVSENASGRAATGPELSIEPAAEPDLAPAVDGLVVLPMPLRSEAHVRSDTMLSADVSTWSEDDALALLAATFSTNHQAAAEVVARRFLDRSDRRVGWSVVLLAGGRRWDPSAPFFGKTQLDPAVDHPDSPAAAYVAMRAKQEPPAEQAIPFGPGAGALRWLDQAHRVLQGYWQGAYRTSEDQAAAAERLVALASGADDPELRAVALVTSSQYGHRSGDAARREAALWLPMESVPGWRQFARYERAAALHRVGVVDAEAESCRLFFELHDEALDAGGLLALDHRFTLCRWRNGNEDAWRDHWIAAAKRLVASHRRADAMRLALQARWLGDAPLSEDVAALALDDCPENERLEVGLLGVELLWNGAEVAPLGRLVDQLVLDERLAKVPGMWRLRAVVADRRGDVARALECEETALALEFADLPDVVDLAHVRGWNGRYMQRLVQVAQALASVRGESGDLLERVIRAADRWRAVDPDPTAACNLAAQALRAAGAQDLAFDYLVTPLAQRPNEGEPWHALGQELARTGDESGATTALATAFAIEPTNAQYLWDLAEGHLRAGRTADARAAWQQLAEGTWQPRFEPLQQSARSRLR